jgi:hypothetical protein
MMQLHRIVIALFLIALTGCKRESDTTSVNATASNPKPDAPLTISIPSAESADYARRVLDAKIQQASVDRAKELYERWALSPQLRDGYFPDKTLAPIDLSKPTFPEFDVGERSLATIAKVIELIESDNFSRDEIAKKLNIEFHAESFKSVPAAFLSSELWVGKSNEVKDNDFCQIAINKNIELGRLSSELKGGAQYGSYQRANGGLDYFSLVLPSIAVDATAYRSTREFEWYEKLFPVFYSAPGDVDKVNWFEHQQSKNIPWLKWIYTDRIQSLTSSRSGWNSALSAGAQFKVHPTSQKFEVAVRNGKIQPYLDLDFPPKFSRVDETRGVAEAFGAMAYINNRFSVYVGKKAQFKLQISTMNLSFQHEASAQGSALDRTLAVKETPVRHCVELRVERQYSRENFERVPYNPLDITEIENLLWQFSKGKPKAEAASGLAIDFDKNLAINSTQSYEIVSDNRPKNIAQNHGLKSLLSTSFQDCAVVGNLKAPSTSIEPEPPGCIKHEVISLLTVVPAFVSGPNCISTKKIWPLLFSIRKQQVALLGLDPNKELWYPEIQRNAHFHNLDNLIFGVVPIAIGVTDTPNFDIFGAKVQVLSSNECLVMLEIRPSILETQSLN